MDSKQFNRIRSNAMAEASMEHRNRLKEINKLNKELHDGMNLLKSLLNC